MLSYNLDRQAIDRLACTCPSNRMTRKIRSFLLLCLLGAAALAHAAVPTATVPTDKEQFKLFLLVGQSNMAGRGKVEAADRQPAERVLVLDKQDKWVHQGEPIHFDKSVAGISLGFTFGKLVAQSEPGITVGLIPCAVGGTPISRWQPGGDLFEEAVRRAKIAQESGTLAGILWHQGESEAGNRQRAEAYAQSLSKVIEGFRKELNAPDVPVIVGELGEFLYTRTNPQGKLRSPQAVVVNQQIRSFPDIMPNAGVALSAGLDHKGDVLHFDGDSLKTFGKRYFEAYQKLLGK